MENNHNNASFNQRKVGKYLNKFYTTTLRCKEIRETQRKITDIFFQTKCKIYSACHEKPFLLKPYFCIVTPSLSTGSNEIFIKKEKKSTYFL